MKKRIFSVLLCLCMVLALMPAAAFANEPEPEPVAQITINGADKVCAQQDYNFTVTLADGVTFESCTLDGASFALDNYSGSVSLSYYADKENFTLTVSGMAEGKETISETKTVAISRNHIYVDGICSCGAKQQYTVTYDRGIDENVVGENEEVIKTHGEALTLKGETFTREGYKQIGWEDKEGNEYALGGIYSTDADVTLFPLWSDTTLEVPFIIKVEQGGNVAPGQTTFTLEALGWRGEKKDFVNVSGYVITNGVGEYKGTLTINSLYYLINDGIFVRQVNAGEPNWKYDDAVWYIEIQRPELLAELALRARALEGPAVSYVIYPAGYEESPDGIFYSPENVPVNEMTFTNIYTQNSYYTYTPTEPELKEPELTEPDPTEPGPTEPTEPAEPTESIPEAPASDDVPKTGDDSNMILWIALLLVSGFGATGAVMYSKRKKYVK